jgi:hypothetical protein
VVRELSERGHDVEIIGAYDETVGKPDDHCGMPTMYVRAGQIRAATALSLRTEWN